MGSLSIWHWLIVLAIVALVFGTKRLSGLGSDLGSALRGFRKGITETEEKARELKRETEKAGRPD